MHVPAAQSLAFALGAGSLVSFACARARIPPILPLLAAGLLLGRSGLHVVGTYELGDALYAFVTVAVGVLVFEGGLHLGSARLGRAGRAVTGLLTIGALLTLGLTTLAARSLLGFEWVSALLLGAIVMVTGPTVVQPLLRRFGLTPNLHTTLWAEAVLIDPICVLAVIAALDLCVARATGARGSVSSMGEAALVPLLTGAAIGVAVGLAGKLLLGVLTRDGRLDARQTSLLSVGVSMAAVGLGEWASPQGGLVAVTLCAIIMANAKAIGVEDMRQFKEQVSAILVGALFVLLGSQIQASSYEDLTWRDAAFVAAMILVVRPLSVFAATAGSELTTRERLFAASMAPRGLVAASTCSIAVARLSEVASGEERADPAAAASLLGDALHAQTVLMVLIFATVCQASLFDPLLARLLKVKAHAPPARPAPSQSRSPPGSGTGFA